jgi:hypothetical protein
MQVRIRQVLLALSIFVAIIVMGFTAHRFERHVLALYCSVANVAVGSMTFDDKLEIALHPAPPDEPHRAQDQVQTDTYLDIVPKGRRSGGRMGLSLRRDVYLPWVLYVALLGAAPVTRRWKALTLAGGTLLIALVGIGSTCALIELLVTSQLKSLPQPSELMQSLLQKFLELWLTPPGNRAIAPILLAALALAPRWSSLRRAFLPPAGNAPDSTASQTQSANSLGSH